MKSLRKAYRGERGFTLVELLVVVVILGVLAAVATLAVTRFIGSGNLEAAKTELHQAQTAVVAVLAEAGKSQLDADGFGWWDGSADLITATSGSGDSAIEYDAADSLMGSEFKALYFVAQNGEITNGSLDDQGDLTITNAWSGIQWDGTINGWVKTP